MSIILKHTKDHICTLTLNRPEAMNAFNTEMGLALTDAVVEANADPDVRVIVLTGSGKAFCAGADISQGFGSVADGDDIPVRDGVKRDLGGILTLAMWECETPIIAAMNGAAVGVGLTMTFPADIRIAAHGAKMSLPFSRRGIVYDAASSYFLPRLIGLSAATELSLTGRTFFSEEAKSLRLVHELADKEAVLPRAMEIAQDLAHNVSPRSAAMMKRLLRESVSGANGHYDNGGPWDSHMKESIILHQCFDSHDCHEGVASFFERRAPNFKNFDPKKDA